MKIAHKLAITLLLASATAESCTIPVFRYALDRWRADTFAIAADEAWEKTEAGKKTATLIDDSPANLLWFEDKGPAPGAHLIWARSTIPAWPDALKPEDVDAMVSSPARDKIAKRILGGSSAVWVMVESGDKKQDDAFAKRLQKRLKYLESVAAIPPQDPDDPSSQLGPGPDLKVEFSMIRVKHNDQKERFTVKMIAGPMGKELLDGTAPFAAPVFGRGRVLGAWTAEDLDDAGVDEISLFLLGACSCRVKAQNPGWDLLMNVDWDEKLMDAEVAKDEEKEETPPTSPAVESENPAPAQPTP